MIRPELLEYSDSQLRLCANLLRNACSTVMSMIKKTQLSVFGQSYDQVQKVCIMGKRLINKYLHPFSPSPFSLYLTFLSLALSIIPRFFPLPNILGKQKSYSRSLAKISLISLINSCLWFFYENLKIWLCFKGLILLNLFIMFLKYWILKFILNFSLEMLLIKENFLLLIPILFNYNFQNPKRNEHII